MEWLLEIVQNAVSVPVCLDSPDPEVLEQAWSLLDQPPIINSISLERDRFETMPALVEGRKCSIIALCMDDKGLPQAAQEVVDRTGRLLEGLEKVGLERSDIYVDPLVQPIATDVTRGGMAMESVQGIMGTYPGIHTVCGLSTSHTGFQKGNLSIEFSSASSWSPGLIRQSWIPLMKRLWPFSGLRRCSLAMTNTV